MKSITVRWLLPALLGVASCGGDGESGAPASGGSGGSAGSAGSSIGGSGGGLGGDGGQSGGAGGTAGAAGAAGAAGSGGGVSGPRAYVLFTHPTTKEAHFQVVDLESGALLAEKSMTSPVPNGTVQAVSPLPDGTARVLWNQGGGMAVTANLDPKLAPVGAPFAYTTGDPPNAHAYARRKDLSGVLLWAGSGTANTWSLDASGASIGAPPPDTISLTELPLSADFDQDDQLWILWSDESGKAVVDRTFIFPFGKIPLSQLPAGEGYRSVSVEETRIRIGIANDGASTGKVCTYMPSSAMLTIPTAVGWGIDQCAAVSHAAGWNFRGYYVSE